MSSLTLDLKDIQGDILIGLQKHAENFIFFKVVDVAAFKTLLKAYVIRRTTSSERTKQWELLIQRRKGLGQRIFGSFRGLNLGFTNDGMTQLIRGRRP